VGAAQVAISVAISGCLSAARQSHYWPWPSLAVCARRRPSSQRRLEGAQSKNAKGRTWPFGSHPRLAALMYEQIDRTMEFRRKSGRIVPWVSWWGEGVQLGDFRKHWGRAKRCRPGGCHQVRWLPEPRVAGGRR